MEIGTPPPWVVFPLINSPLIYGIFTLTGRPQSGRQAKPDENPVNQGGIYEGENDPGGGTYFQPISYLNFLGPFDFSLSSHNSSEKKSWPEVYEIHGAGGAHLIGLFK